MANGSEANDDVSYVQELCCEKAWGKVENPRFATLRGRKENAQQVNGTEYDSRYNVVIDLE
jgi:hypothetical protein